MRDIGAVVALALHHVGFRPDSLLHRAQLYSVAEYLRVYAVAKPFVVHACRAVAGAEDQIGEIFSAVGFAEPMGEGQLRVTAHDREGVKRPLAVVGANEDIEIFRVAPDAGVAFERISAADQKRHRALGQRRQNPDVELFPRLLRTLVTIAVHGRTSRLIPLPWSARTAAGISIRRKTGLSGKFCLSTLIATLYTGTPLCVRPSGVP